MDLDLGIHLLISSLFFLSSPPPIELVVLVGFESEGFEHFLYSCPLHWLHRFEFSTRIRLSEVENLVSLGCLGAIELVPPGYVGALDGR